MQECWIRCHNIWALLQACGRPFVHMATDSHVPQMSPVAPWLPVQKLIEQLRIKLLKKRTNIESQTIRNKLNMEKCSNRPCLGESGTA